MWYQIGVERSSYVHNSPCFEDESILCQVQLLFLQPSTQTYRILLRPHLFFSLKHPQTQGLLHATFVFCNFNFMKALTFQIWIIILTAQVVLSPLNLSVAFRVRRCPHPPTEPYSNCLRESCFHHLEGAGCIKWFCWESTAALWITDDVNAWRRLCMKAD
jgi:hypothetical protein